MRVASYNVENLFRRPTAFLDADGKANEDVLTTYSRLTELLAKESYADHKEEILDLLRKLKLDKVTENKTAVLRKIRGTLLGQSKETGAREVVATGRADWIGWVELAKTDVDSRATENTARVIAEVKPDVLAVIEAEDRMTLERFEEYVLKKVTQEEPFRFEHVMLLDGNDERGIDVGAMTGEGFPIKSIRSHVDDKKGGKHIFSRDCVEYSVPTPDGGSLLLMVNHFRSKIGGGIERRREQSERAAEIYEERRGEGWDRIAIAGDLNDTPESKSLEPLIAETDLKDAGTHKDFDWRKDEGEGTYEDGDQIDYLLLSPALFDAVEAGGVNRRGIWKKSNLGDEQKMLKTLTDPIEAASDHAAIWVDLNV